MFETFDGLPAHPLVVHLPVVLVPLAALAVLALALRPRLLRTFGVVVTVLAGVGFAGALLATNSGEALEESFRAAGQTIPETLRDHAEITATTCAVPPIAPAPAYDRTTQRASAMTAERQRIDAVRSPRTIGFSTRPALLSRSASRASLHHPTDNCSQRTAAATRTRPSRSRPAAAATVVTTNVTVAVGPG